MRKWRQVSSRQANLMQSKDDAAANPNIRVPRCMVKAANTGFSHRRWWQACGSRWLLKRAQFAMIMCGGANRRAFGLQKLGQPAICALSTSAISESCPSPAMADRACDPDDLHFCAQRRLSVLMQISTARLVVNDPAKRRCFLVAGLFAGIVHRRPLAARKLFVFPMLPVRPGFSAAFCKPRRDSRVWPSPTGCIWVFSPNSLRRQYPVGLIGPDAASHWRGAFCGAWHWIWSRAAFLAIITCFADHSSVGQFSGNRLAGNRQPPVPVTRAETVTVFWLFAMGIMAVISAPRLWVSFCLPFMSVERGLGWRQANPARTFFASCMNKLR